MSQLVWRKFDYKSLDEIQRDIDALGLDLPMSQDFSILGEPFEAYGMRVKNRIAIQPLEGYDCALDGTPSDLTFRRYRRFAAGGAGLIWFESVAPTHNSQTNPYQAHINEGNVEVYKRLLMEIRDYAADGERPMVICQLTHCGRNARLDVEDGDQYKEDGIPQYVAYKNPYFPKPNVVVLSDEEIEEIGEDYVQAAKLCKLAGFDAVDVRACHGYFITDLLSAYTRENSKYGGSFENRTRFLIETLTRIKNEVGIPLAIRINACDLVPYPYGWGMAKDGSMTPDLTEPNKLIGILVDMGVEIINISMACNHALHIQMPYNVNNVYPKDHQLTAHAFYHGLAKSVKEANPKAIVMTGTLSWPKQYGANMAAGGLQAGYYDVAGWGRQPFCYPEFANDMLKNGGMKEEKCCLGCNCCVHMMRAECHLGCVPHDSEIYAPIYKKYVKPELRDLGYFLHKQLFDVSDHPPKQE